MRSAVSRFSSWSFDAGSLKLIQRGHRQLELLGLGAVCEQGRL
jgi:hypothetical protein